MTYIKKPHIHYLQHVPYEGLGCLRSWVEKNNYSLSSTQFYNNDGLPMSVDSIDVLIVMGGPMGINDEKIYPWLAQEKMFIKQAILKNKIVLGICLGAQLIASCLGAKVHSCQKKEIGWFPVRITSQGKETGLFPDIDSFMTFHWHADSFDIPDKSIRLFESQGCKNQGFLYNETIMGIQFHFEVTKKSLLDMTHYGRKDLIPSFYVQSYEEIISYTVSMTSNHNYLITMLERLIKGYLILLVVMFI